MYVKTVLEGSQVECTTTQPVEQAKDRSKAEKQVHKVGLNQDAGRVTFLRLGQGAKKGMFARPLV
jgi:hypothetical protein